jgi:hypothetical protein
MVDGQESTSEELRGKLRKKTESFDKDAIVFMSKVIKLALEEFHCDATCQEWQDLLYQDYIRAGSPTDRLTWIRDRLAREVLCVDVPPDWGTDEPEWRFHQGRPMVFIRQFALPDNRVTRSAVTRATMLYVFGIRVPSPTATHPEAYRMVYEVVERPTGLQTAEDHYREEQERMKG